MRSHDLNRLLDKPGSEASTLLEISFSIPPHANDFWAGQAGGADDSGRHCNARAPGCALLRVAPAAFNAVRPNAPTAPPGHWRADGAGGLGARIDFRLGPG